MLNEKKRSGLILKTAPHIKAAHAFTTRFGGVSRGPFSSLNLSLGAGDDPRAVHENYRRLIRSLGYPSDTNPVITRQVHGNTVYTLTRDDAYVSKFNRLSREADALVTNMRGIPIIIFTADCVPLLLYDPIRGIIAAVHAGWRGTVADVVSKAVDAMWALGSVPSNIKAAIGPSISKCCFETGTDVRDAVLAMPGLDSAKHISISKISKDKFYIDLKSINRERLISRGLKPDNIIVSDECTACSDDDMYWSHRRLGARRGCQSAVIVLP